jgi:hypothetical protein
VGHQLNSPIAQSRGFIFWELEGGGEGGCRRGLAKGGGEGGDDEGRWRIGVAKGGREGGWGRGSSDWRGVGGGYFSRRYTQQTTLVDNYYTFF